MSIRKWPIIGLLALMASTQAAEAPPGQPPLQLTPSIRAALIEEMQSLARDMQLITAAIPRAEWEPIEQAATRIRGSFILEKKLSAEDRETLGKTLPDGFLLLDQRLHDDAAHLAMAAREGHADVVVFLAARMLDGCVACHSRYVGSRFPGFRPAPSEPHRH